MLCLWALLAAMAAGAQENKAIDVRLEARGDFHNDYLDGVRQKDRSGFKGELLDVFVQGELSPKFAYKYRQRLSGINKDKTFFDATDWLYLDYRPTENLTIKAGKWVVLTGGWEFDPAPIDCYDLFEFCYGFPCYQWGASVDYTTKDKKNTFYVQVCNSPFETAYRNASQKQADMYAYNLMWYGHYGIWHTAWSVNMMETSPGKFINYIGLGNRFKIGNKLQADFDFMNRASSGQRFFFADCTLAARVEYKPLPQLNVFGKVTYDVNQSGTDTDTALHNGTEITRVGGGAEYFPLKNNKVRLHAVYTYSFGKNTNPDGVAKDKQSLFDIGVTWRMRVI